MGPLIPALRPHSVLLSGITSSLIIVTGKSRVTVFTKSNLCQLYVHACLAVTQSRIAVVSKRIKRYCAGHEPGFASAYRRHRKLRHASHRRSVFNVAISSFSIVSYIVDPCSCTLLTAVGTALAAVGAAFTSFFRDAATTEGGKTD